MTNRQRKILRQLHSRHGRAKSPLFLCEGVRCCREALTRQPEWLDCAVCSTTFAETLLQPEFGNTVLVEPDRLTVVPNHEFRRLALTDSPPGLLCVLRRPDPDPDPDEPEVPNPFVLILDQIRDPGNLGTILRSAWAVGLPEIWTTRGTTDPYGPKAIRAGMGAQFALTMRTFPDLETVRGRLRAAGGSRIWNAMPQGGCSCFSTAFEPEHGGLVIGNEADGITDTAGAEAVHIPMPGTAESLNAAQAATVFLFEAVRRGLLPARTTQEQSESTR